MGYWRLCKKLTSFVPGVAEKIQQYRDSLSNMIDDEQITKSVRKAEKINDPYRRFEDAGICAEQKP